MNVVYMRNNWGKNKFGDDASLCVYTYINLGINDVYEASKHNDEIKYIPRIPKVILPKENTQ